jgi:hypothetical protein
MGGDGGLLILTTEFCILICLNPTFFCKIGDFASKIIKSMLPKGLQASVFSRHWSEVSFTNSLKTQMKKNFSKNRIIYPNQSSL